MSRGNGGFNRKQARFIDEYLVDLNGARACRDAGYSEKNAHKQAQALLKDPRIRAAVEVRQLKLSRKTEITAEKVLERLWEEGNREGPGSSHGARVTALGHLAKHFGLLIERVDMTSNGKDMPGTVRVVLVKPGEEPDA